MHPAAASSLPPHAESGFTLLEVLVVLAITVLIAALLYPQVDTARFAVRQRLARENLAAAVEAARAAALRSGAPVTLRTDQSATVLLIGGKRQITVDPARQLRLAVRPQTIAFYPDGSTTGGQLVLGTGRNAAAFEVSRAGGRLLAATLHGNGG
jgi:general secretion pathway protein H